MTTGSATPPHGGAGAAPLPGEPRLHQPPAERPVRRLYRSPDSRVVAGVAQGLSDHLGVPAIFFRVAFVLMAISGGAGIVAYAAFWVLVPQGVAPAAERRPNEPTGARSTVPLLAVGAVLVGLLILTAGTRFAPIGGVGVPVMILAVGVALLWRVADDSQRARWRTTAGFGDGATGSRGAWLRVAGGLGLMLAGVIALLASRGGLQAAVDGLAGGLVLLAGLALVAGPWLLRATRELRDERRERIRAQEREEIAAHVHDSVLQTLTLIQRNADDPRAVLRLARAEERSLRQWLYRPGTGDTRTFRVALEEVAAEVEDAHGGTFEVVVVGDAGLDEQLGALLQAAREAMVNAAKYAGEHGPVSVYAEVEPQQASVFVRDRGLGFEPADVPSDRLGISMSIIGRMERRRGRAEVRATPGEGVEVRLFMPRSAPAERDSSERDSSQRDSSRGGPAVSQLPRVVLVDDHRMFRSGVRAELGDSVDVVGEAADVESAVNVIAATRPDVVLLDVHLPGGDGGEVIRGCAAAGVETTFLALSVSDAAEDVIGVIRAGARGYVTKSITGPELADAVRRVADGDAVFSPRLAGFVLDAFAGSAEVPVVDEELDRLSQREREVLRLIARGYAYKEVARELFISVKTVETHVSAVLRKLQLSNRHELTIWATDRRLI